MQWAKKVHLLIVVITGCLILMKQISRRFPGGILRKIQDMFALLRPPMQCTDVVCLDIEQKYDMHFIQHEAVAKIK